MFSEKEKGQGQRPGGAKEDPRSVVEDGVVKRKGGALDTGEGNKEVMQVCLRFGHRLGGAGGREQTWPLTA